jgi:RNA polymerase sigma-70 factor (ECF subfamily)
MSDELINRLAHMFRNGDMESFRLLVESLTRPLIAAAFRYTNDWESARDLTQDTWIKVYERIGRYDPSRPFRNWLMTVHRNHCLNHIRSAAVRLETTGSQDMAFCSTPCHDPDPIENIDRKRFRERINLAMTRLSDRERRAFALVDLEQTDQREAAGILGMKQPTLRTTLHHARRKLARLLRTMEE